MCWICAADRSQLALNYLSGRIAAHYQQPGGTDPGFALTDGSINYKPYDAFPIDGVGDLKPVTTTNVLILTPDNIADDTSTTATVTVDGPSIVSTINTIGDQ